jgi:Flp pilus assembly CpaF family ATPase
VTTDAALMGRLHRVVADRLSERLRTVEGDGGLSSDDERALTRSLIAEELERMAEAAYRDGRDPLTPREEQDLSEGIFDRLWGLGRLQSVIDDRDLANIHVNGFDNVWLVYRDGTKVRGDPVADSDHELVEVIATAARRWGRSEKRWDRMSWELHLQLPGGERLHAVLGLTGRPTITIRRHDFSIYRLKHMVELGAVDESLHAFLAAAVRAKLNLIVAGGTNTGKTTMLRCLLNEIPPEERVVTVEDNLEIGLDRFQDLHPDQVCWERRGANIEGRGEVTLADCVRATLRQNPDRVVVGEIRGVEVVDMLRAMSQGNDVPGGFRANPGFGVDMLRAMSQGNDGSMSLIHADSSKGAIVRLGMYTAEAGLDEETSNKWIANAVDLIVHLGWVDGVRRVSSVREVLEAEARQIATNEVYRPAADGRAVPAPGRRSARTPWTGWLTPGSTLHCWPTRRGGGESERLAGRRGGRSPRSGRVAGGGCDQAYPGAPRSPQTGARGRSGRAGRRLALGCPGHRRGGRGGHGLAGGRIRRLRRAAGGAGSVGRGGSPQDRRGGGGGHRHLG